MKQASSPVTSRQQEPHPRLGETVRKHRDHPWRKPVADHSRAAFGALAPRVEAWSGPWILDTGCGTGLGTARLAQKNPQALVLGIDKSPDRLGRAPDLPANALVARMDLEDFWLLARDAGWRFSLQCFFYPNPWPKPEQRLRRWPFHPVLPTVLACGEVWEVRTNWEIYAQEFALAYAELTGRAFPVEPWVPAEPDTLFEKKYSESGHRLWRWQGS
jgi:tRNA G46 methylase TrmB